MKKVWKVNLEIIEQYYHGRSSTQIGFADDCTEAERLAIKKENQGRKHRRVTVTSIEYLGELSF